MKRLISTAVMLLLAGSLTGCIEVANKVDKVMTLRTWETENSPVIYATFNAATGVRISFSTRPFPVQIADSDAWLRFTIDYGNAFVQLHKIEVTPLTRDLQPFDAFLAWADKPLATRQAEKAQINARADYVSNHYSVVNEAGTDEPLFIFRGDIFLFSDPVQLALTRADVANIIVEAQRVQRLYNLKNAKGSS